MFIMNQQNCGTQPQNTEYKTQIEKMRKVELNIIQFKSDVISTVGVIVEILVSSFNTKVILSFIITSSVIF